jgi:hypothetical protein
MSARRIGGPCPKCGAVLMRRERARLFRTGSGDVAYCARCNAAWDIEDDVVRSAPDAPLLTPSAALG